MRIAVLGALEPEIALLVPDVDVAAEHTLAGLKLWAGHLDGVEVFLGRSGVGKVNAAMVTTLVLERFRPDYVLFTGVAGGINPALVPGDVVIATRTTQHDYGRQYTHGFMGLSPLNVAMNQRHPAFFPASEHLLNLARRAAGSVPLKPAPSHLDERSPRIVEGIIATGDLFAVAESKKRELRERLGADACEMESAAVAQVCAELGVGFLTVRGISDIAEDIDAPDREDLAAAAENAAGLARAIIRGLAAA
jgi:adenosylhomocysteine nucleosidase